MRKPELKRDAIPMYHQIYLLLRDEILSGKRAFGDAMPTEAGLALSYAVSRITARRVLEELAEHGFVVRRRRTGTVVSFRSPVKPIEGNLDQAVESLLVFGRGTKVRVQEIETVPATGVVATRLELSEGEPVVRALRVRFSADAPLGAIESFVPAALGISLTRELLVQQPILALIMQSDRKIGTGVQTIASVPADPSLAGLIEIAPREPILRVERVVRDVSGKPLLFTRAHYRGDRYQLTLDLHGAALPVFDHS